MKVKSGSVALETNSHISLDCGVHALFSMLIYKAIVISTIVLSALYPLCNCSNVCLSAGLCPGRSTLGPQSTFTSERSLIRSLEQ
ncbi:hypothetical protein J6590_014605 [Homalodisca vitripennis]|nr:hypothetical protein J6590_014605 [Homalodisca vitripennis]